MSNLAEKMDYRESDNQGVTLSYPAHLKFLYFVMNLQIILLATMSAVPIIRSYKEENWNDVIFNIILNGFLFSLLYFQVRFLFKPLINTKFYLSKDELKIEQYKKMTDFPFNQITSVKFPKISFSFNILLVGPEKKKIRINMNLKRYYLILEAIAKFNPNLIPNNQLLKYRTFALANEQSWAQIYDLFKAWKASLVRIFIPPLITSILLLAFKSMIPQQESSISLKLGLIYFLAATFINIIIICTLWAIFGSYLDYQTRKEIRNHQQLLNRNDKKEKAVLNLALKAHTILFLILSLFSGYRIYVLSTRIQISNSPMEIKKSAAEEYHAKLEKTVKPIFYSQLKRMAKEVSFSKYVKIMFIDNDFKMRVQVSADTDGNILESKVVQSSGFTLFDDLCNQVFPLLKKIPLPPESPNKENKYEFYWDFIGEV